jgi:LL-diaminopimelate aminotransferase
VKSLIGSDAARIKKIPTYLFADLDKLKQKYQEQSGRRIIDFGEGNPLFTPPDSIIKHFIKALKKPDNHRYPSYTGKISARVAVVEWYKKRFGVKLDPATEVAMLIGSKEGVAHLIWSIIDQGDIAYIPSPAYPVYMNQTLLAGGKVKILPLLQSNNFLANLDDIKPDKKLKLLCLNYPNNPTAAMASLSYYQEVVNKASKYGFYCFNDNVYSELYYSKPPHSILEITGAKEHCVEFHSLSKTCSMAGWRIGFIVGNKDIIKALLRIKQNVDSGPFGAIQDAAIYALQNIDKISKNTRIEYHKRISLLVNGLNKLGWKISMPKATFYLWIKAPSKKYRQDSLSFTCSLLEKTGILVAPGRGFGKEGEGYLRFAVIVSIQDIGQTIDRLSTFKLL